MCLAQSSFSFRRITSIALSLLTVSWSRLLLLPSMHRVIISKSHWISGFGTNLLLGTKIQNFIFLQASNLCQEFLYWFLLHYLNQPFRNQSGQLLLHSYSQPSFFLLMLFLLFRYSYSPVSFKHCTISLVTSLFLALVIKAMKSIYSSWLTLLAYLGWLWMMMMLFLFEGFEKKDISEVAQIMGLLHDGGGSFFWGYCFLFLTVGPLDAFQPYHGVALICFPLLLLS